MESGNHCFMFKEKSMPLGKPKKCAGKHFKLAAIDSPDSNFN